MKKAGTDTEALIEPETLMVPALIPAQDLPWLIVGSGEKAVRALQTLLQASRSFPVMVVAPQVSPAIKKLALSHEGLELFEEAYGTDHLSGAAAVIAATGDRYLDMRIREEAAALNLRICLPDHPSESDFVLPAPKAVAAPSRKERGFAFGSEQTTRRLASRLVLAFFLMVFGHIIISYLPLPTVGEMWTGVQPYFDRQFFFFILAGFLAQMVDGLLSMGYGVTSATCLMSMGVNPVAMSAAIHTSEVFTSGISGYSHYKFGNVNKKLFRHLVIPGVMGAIIGAVLLVYLGEKAGKWLMPLIAVYALFLGLKILFKAFKKDSKPGKVKRVGWLAWIGGFLDSFGGGGWGPIVTSTLISKGRSPKYTIGSVSLTEFFVTLSSAITFFITAGVGHWNVVLGLLLGGSLAAPLAARMAGKLPRKTMMIAVGVMVMIWCIRMIIKSL
jgi:uncharacterized membrane protein YfcA